MYIILAILLIAAVYLYYRRPVQPPAAPVLVNSKPLYDWNGTYSDARGTVTIKYDGHKMQFISDKMPSLEAQFVDNNYAGFVLFGLKNNGQTLDFNSLMDESGVLTKTSGNVNPIGTELTANVNYYDSPWNGTWNVSGSKMTLQRQNNDINYIKGNVILTKAPIQPDGSILIGDSKLVLNGDEINAIVDGQVVERAVRLGQV